MTIYLIHQRGDILAEISEPTIQGIFVVFTEGTSLNWDGMDYRIETREQRENGDIYFYLSER